MVGEVVTHPDTFKMSKSEVEAHAATGCDRCRDALRWHEILDRLIESQSKTLEALDRLDGSVRALESVKS